MADPASDSEQAPDERIPPPGMPRWVKVFGIVAILAVTSLIVVMLLIGGDHGPGRHNPGGDASAVNVAVVDAAAGW